MNTLTVNVRSRAGTIDEQLRQVWLGVRGTLAPNQRPDISDVLKMQGMLGDGLGHTGRGPVACIALPRIDDTSLEALKAELRPHARAIGVETSPGFAEVVDSVDPMFPVGTKLVEHIYPLI